MVDHSLYLKEVRKTGGMNRLHLDSPRIATAHIVQGHAADMMSSPLAFIDGINPVSSSVRRRWRKADVLKCGSDVVCSLQSGVARTCTAAACATLLSLHPMSMPAHAFTTLSEIEPGTRVADLEHVLTKGEGAALEKRLAQLDQQGVRVRLLSQGNDNAPGTAIRPFFNLGDDSALIVVDVRGGNILNFRIGDAVLHKLPQSFWVELGNRYGNAFYVRDKGMDVAVLDAVRAIEDCARPGRNICRYVPGVSQDQLAISICSAAAAGVIAGAASRTGGKTFNVPFFLLYSPIWSIFLVSFGIGPVLSRQSFAHLETAAVLGAFLVCAAAIWWWVPNVLGAPAGASDDKI